MAEGQETYPDQYKENPDETKYGVGWCDDMDETLSARFAASIAAFNAEMVSSRPRLGRWDSDSAFMIRTRCIVGREPCSVKAVRKTPKTVRVHPVTRRIDVQTGPCGEGESYSWS